MDRFEQAKAAVIKKYSMMERPQGKLRDKVAVCVDALCTLVVGGFVGVQRSMTATVAPPIRQPVNGTYGCSARIATVLPPITSITRPSRSSCSLPRPQA